jgi:hypothetical protein
MAVFNWVRYECGCEEGLGIPSTSLCRQHQKPVKDVNAAHKTLPPKDGWMPLQEMLDAPLKEDIYYGDKARRSRRK